MKHFIALVLIMAAPAASVRSYWQSHQHAILQEFVELLSIPNLHNDSTNIRRNAHALEAMMKRRGIKTQLLEAAGSPPAVFGELAAPGATRTLVFYAHYDGQPVVASQWKDAGPWNPMVRNGRLEDGARVVPFPKPDERIDPQWRIYARSASDDKGAIIAMLTALDALAASKTPLTSNLKFFFEGEEEAGSPHLRDMLTRHRDVLAADAWMMCDGPTHQTGRKLVAFGVRGITKLDLTVYGANRSLHSGHYGNWAPNPAMQLARLLASMKDETGRVTVAGFYDDVKPLGPLERRALAEAPSYDRELMQEFGLTETEGAGKSLAELINRPALNVLGLSSAQVMAESRNAIPTQATATIDLRLVDGNDHQRQIARVIEHVRRQGYTVIDTEPTAQQRLQHPRIARILAREAGYNAHRTPMDLPIARQVVAAVQSTSEQTIVRLPTMGGSLPIYIFGQIFGRPLMTVPIANFDNNQHAENENIRLQNLWEGIETMAAIMTMK